MMKYFRRKLMLLILFLFAGLPLVQAQTGLQDVKQNLKKRYQAGDMLGIVVAYIDSTGQATYFSYGYLSSRKEQPVNKNTIFEIGSVTKTFTSLILADLAQRHIVSPDDPISNFLPDSIRVPAKNGRKITLQQLAMHTSGLPRLPSNFHPSDWLNPYADYTAPDLLQFLNQYELSVQPGTSFQYSNLGAGLLGYLLETAEGESYTTLVKNMITGPLGMNSTFIEVPKSQRDRFAEPYNFGKQVKHWTFSSLAGAGAIRSTAKDLVIYLKAQMGLKQTGLAPAIQETRQMRFHVGKGNIGDIGLAWIQSTTQDSIIWHDGGTGGFRSFVGWNKQNHTGVVILESGTDNINDAGFHLLDPKHKLRLQLDPDALKRYTGTYQFSPAFSIKIIKRGGQLFEKATGQQELPIFPQSKTKFDVAFVGARLVFVADKNGIFVKMKLLQNGHTSVGKRNK